MRAPTAGALRLVQRFPGRSPGLWLVSGGRSDLDHFEVFFSGTAIRASPGQRNIIPPRAGRYAAFGIPRGFVVNETANQTHVGFHSVLALCIGIALRRGLKIDSVTGRGRGFRAAGRFCSMRSFSQGPNQ